MIQYSYEELKWNFTKIHFSDRFFRKLFFRTIYDGSIRYIEFNSIFVIKTLTGILLLQIFNFFTNRGIKYEISG